TELALKKELSELTNYLTEFLSAVNNRLEHHEQLARLIVMKEEWTIQNGLLTPTLKIKRKVMDQRFQEQYATWYETPKSIIFL
ncbi:hypothetical protein ACP3WC_24095, partial [Salmonella enterica]|uniref:hypothetical protein n=1 Tax=Salmonella enterica TaxID=28901 RepID=UPI003CE74EC5